MSATDQQPWTRFVVRGGGMAVHCPEYWPGEQPRCERCGWHRSLHDDHDGFTALPYIAAPEPDQGAVFRVAGVLQRALPDMPVPRFRELCESVARAATSDDGVVL